MHGSVQDRQRQVNDTRRLVVGLGSQRICSVQDRQVNDTRRSVVGGLAHTDRWQTEVDEVATVNQYEPTGKPLSCVVAFEGLLSYIQLQQECKPTMEIARTQISRVFVADSKVGKDSWCSNGQDIKVCVTNNESKVDKYDLEGNR